MSGGLTSQPAKTMYSKTLWTLFFRFDVSFDVMLFLIMIRSTSQLVSSISSGLSGM